MQSSDELEISAPKANPKKIGHRQKPHNMIDLTLSTHCQARCPECPRTGKDGQVIPGLKLEHLSMDILRKMTNSKLFNETAIVRFSGNYGDPMMHPKVEEIIDICVSKVAYVIISTNGALRNAAWYTHLGNKYKDKLRIIFGIDGTNQEVNNMYRVDVNFDKAYENMKSFAATPADAEWQYIIFEHNYHQIDDAIKMATDINCSLFFMFDGWSSPLALSAEKEESLTQYYTINEPLWKLLA